ncbi:MAG TPA: glycosyltransferase family 39 protein [Vicinamibacterales bacterium]|nr:glycosyltransferase family 39 protein [Vicinamibacterales bacterium]
MAVVTVTGGTARGPFGAVTPLSLVLAAVCVASLALGVHTGLERVRLRVVTEPSPAQGTSLAIPLPDLSPLAAEPAALIVRLQGGAAASRIAVILDGVRLVEVDVPAGREVRVNAAVRVQAATGSQLLLRGGPPGWAVTYVEFANVYGFSRGVFSFVVVPRERGGIPRVPLSVLLPVFLILVLLRPRLSWPADGRLRLARRTLAALVLLVFAAVLGTPRFTKYRLLLSWHTYGLAVAVLYAEWTIAGLRLLAGTAVTVVQRTAPYATAGGRGLGAFACWRPLPAAIAMLVSVAATGFAWRQGTHVAGGADSYGYVSQAALWAEGRMSDRVPIARHLPADVGDWAATPLGYVPAPTSGERGRIVPSYAPGLPLLMAAFRRVGGSEAVYAVVPLLAGATIWLTFLLGRRLLGDVAGCFAACWMATTPPWVVASLTPMSDVPAAAFWTGAVAAALHGTRMGAALAGVCAAAAILTRPNLAPLAGAVALPWLWRIWKGAGSRRDHVLALGIFALLTAAAAGIVAATFSYWYGSPVRSGYGPFEYLFSQAHIVPNLQRYPVWLASTATPLIAAAVAAPLVLEARARVAGFLLVFCALVWAAYLPYLPFETWEYLRFVLPSYPALFALTASVLVYAVRRTLAPRLLGLVLLSLLVVHGAWFEIGLANVDLAGFENRYRRIGDFVRTSFPRRAVFVAMQHSGSLRFYGHREILRWDLLPEGRLDSIVAHLQAAGYEPYFVLERWEEAGFRERYAAGNRLGRLDWPPGAVAAGKIPVAIYDPRDREAATPVVTRSIP